MSKRIWYNDQEVIVNEDVFDDVSYARRDYHRLIEGELFRTLGNASGLTAGQVQAGCVLSGFDITRSTTNMNVTIAPGMAAIAFGGVDATIESNYQVATLETAATLTVSPPSIGFERYDVVEISGLRSVANETREVLALVAGRRRLVPTPVPKLQTNSVQVRIRPGVQAATGTAMCPALRPDQAWIPIHVLYVPSGATTASGSIWLQDHRKFLKNVVPGISFGQNLASQPSVKAVNDDNTIRINAGRLLLGDYVGELKNQIGAGMFALAPSSEFIMAITGSTVLPASIAPAADKWFYLYAYRPDPSSGYVSVLISDLPPVSGTSARIFSAPAGVVAPRPWTSASLITYHLASFKMYDSGSGVWRCRDFVRTGTYTAVTGARDVFAGTNDNVVFNGGVSAAGQNVTVEDASSALAIPPHVNFVRLQVDLSNATATRTLGTLRVQSVGTATGFATNWGNINFDMTQYVSQTATVDIYLGGTGGRQIRLLPTFVSGTLLNVIVRVVGFFEEVP
jgi:hypothetical protein